MRSSTRLGIGLLPLLGLASCSLINGYDDVPGGGGGDATSSSSGSTTSQGGGSTTTSTSSQGGGTSSSQGGGGTSSQGGGGGGEGGAGGGVPTLPLTCQFVGSSQRLAGSTMTVSGASKRVDELYPQRVGSSVRVVGVRRAVDTAIVDQYDVPDDNQQGTLSQTSAFTREAVFHVGRVGDAIGLAVREFGGERIELQRWRDVDSVNTFFSSVIADPTAGSILNARFEALTDHNDVDVLWERSTGSNSFGAFFNHYDGTLETTNNVTVGGNGTTVASRFPGPVVRAGSDVVAFLGLPTMSSTASSTGFRFQVTSPPGTGTAMRPNATAMVGLGKPVAGEHPWAALVGFADEIQLRVGAVPSADVDDIDTSGGAVAHSFALSAPVDRFRAEIFGTVLVLAGYVSGEPALLVADTSAVPPLLALHFDILDRTPTQGYGQGFGVRPRVGFNAEGGLLDVAWSEENPDGVSDTIWVGAIDCRQP